MKRLLLLVLVALCIAGYFFRQQLVPVITPYVPQAVVTFITPATPNAPDAGNSGDAAGGRSKKSGGEGGGKSGGGRRGGSSGPPAVLVTSAKTGSLPILRQTVGTVVPAANTSLASQTPGFVLDISVKDGATVKAGDVLFSLDDRAIQALIDKDNATLAKDKTILEDANRKLDRLQKLVTSGVYNQQQGDDAQAAMRVAAAAVVVDKAVVAADNVTLSNTKIKAPFDGRIGAILVSRGAFVASGAPMATITEMAPVYAEFTLSETDLALARQTMASNALTVNVVPTMADPATKPVSGPVVFIDSSVDSGSGTFKLRAEIANSDGLLWPGQALRVEVHAGDVTGLVTIPVVAMIQTRDGSAVNVVKADNTIEIRKIVPALKVGDVLGVASGLSEGEQVVVEGQLNLASGATVKIADPNAAAAKPDAPAADASAGTDATKPADGSDPAKPKHRHKKDGSGAGANP